MFRDTKGIVHVVLCNKPRIKRNGRHHTVCAKRVDQSMTRISAHHEPGRSAVVTCEADLRFMTALSTIVDEDEAQEIATKREYRLAQPGLPG